MGENSNVLLIPTVYWENKLYIIFPDLHMSSILLF